MRMKVMKSHGSHWNWWLCKSGDPVRVGRHVHVSKSPSVGDRQIESYDAAAEEDEILFVTIPCVRALIKLAGVTLGKRWVPCIWWRITVVKGSPVFASVVNDRWLIAITWLDSNCFRRAVGRQLRGNIVKMKKDKASKDSIAAVTPLVQMIFESMFQGQMEEKGQEVKKRRCGVCEVRNHDVLSSKICFLFSQILDGVSGCIGFNCYFSSQEVSADGLW